MSLTLLKRNEINHEKWDTCVERSSKPLIYGLSWYLDAATDGNWDGLVWGDYEVVLPLPWNKKNMFKQVYSPYQTQQLGPFYSKPVPEFLQSSLEFIQSKYVQITLGLSEYVEDSMCKTNLIIHLDKPYSELFKQYGRGKKVYNKPKYQHFRLEEISSEQFFNFYDEHHRFSFTAKDLKRFYNIVEECKQHSASRLVAAVNGKTIESVIFFSVYQQRITTLLSATSPSGYDSGANIVIINKVIQEYADTPTVLDFEGSDVAGIRFFYKSFGAVEENYYIYRKQNKWLQTIQNIRNK